MSIASELQRIINAKAALKNSINAKTDASHQITTENLDDFPSFVDTISGGGSTDIYKVSSIQERDELLNINEGDMCVVSNTALGPINAGTVFNYCELPNNVTLDNAISNNYNAYFNSTGSTMIDFSVYLSSSRCDINIYIDNDGEYIDGNASYSSQDGINYTLDSIQGDAFVNNTLTLPETIRYMFGEWSNDIGEFIHAVTTVFTGIYTYKDSAWEYADVNSIINADQMYLGNTAYTNNGFVQGNVNPEEYVKFNVYGGNTVPNNIDAEKGALYLQANATKTTSTPFSISRYSAFRFINGKLNNLNTHTKLSSDYISFVPFTIIGQNAYGYNSSTRKISKYDMSSNSLYSYSFSTDNYNDPGLVSVGNYVYCLLPTGTFYRLDTTSTSYTTLASCPRGTTKHDSYICYDSVRNEIVTFEYSKLSGDSDYTLRKRSYSISNNSWSSTILTVPADRDSFDFMQQPLISINDNGHAYVIVEDAIYGSMYDLSDFTRVKDRTSFTINNFAETIQLNNANSFIGRVPNACTYNIADYINGDFIFKTFIGAQWYSSFSGGCALLLGYYNDKIYVSYPLSTSAGTSSSYYHGTYTIENLMLGRNIGGILIFIDDADTDNVCNFYKTGSLQFNINNAYSRTNEDSITPNGNLIEKIYIYNGNTWDLIVDNTVTP